MHLLDLNGRWQMKRTDEAIWQQATVPGSVYNDLINSGKLDDPFYRENEYEALEISKYDYEYQRGFEIDTDTLKYDVINLLCKGLDTLSSVFINGNKVLGTDNMHRTYEIDIKEWLTVGSNHIHVIFNSPVEYVLRKQSERPLDNSGDAIEGISHLRKAHYMFGWDWGPKLPDMGIWRDISIRCFNHARMEDVYITQRHSQEKVELDVRVKIEKWLDSDYEILVAVNTPEGAILEKKVALDNVVPHDKTEKHICIIIEDPQLWWPNNFGKQPLYSVNVTLVEKGNKLDKKSLRIGLRTLIVKREKDQWGESFQFEVNGISVFSMGADFIPEDNILARLNREKTEILIKSCIEANFNSIRVWGGAYYPEDYFFDLCDEYGLIVWQDLMYACGTYDLTEEFKDTIVHETVDNMKRLRHHASLGLWCGNNEQEWGWVSWGWNDLKLKADYIKMYEYILPQIAEEIDPNTFYWLASPSSTGSFDKPNDENIGDMHYWGVWHGRNPFTDYRKIFPRYMSEFGLQSFPSMKTIETFTLPEDRNIFSYVMESHQKCGTGNEKILYYIGDHYKYPKDFDSLLYASQLIQAEGLRYGVEHWRRNRGRCMGAIYWQLNDCWPVASWASIDCFGRWKALHYTAKKFFAPILVSACEEGTNVSIHVSNESIEGVSGTLTWALMDAKSNIMEKAEKEIQIDALSSKEFENHNFAEKLKSKQLLRNSYLEYSFLIGNEVVSSGTVLFVRAKHFNFVNPEIKTDISEESDKFIILVKSKAFARFVELDIKEADAVFSDNFFDLSAGCGRRIEIRKDRLSKNLSLADLRSQLTVRSLIDTY